MDNYEQKRNNYKLPYWIHSKFHYLPHIFETKLLIALIVCDIAPQEPPPELDGWLVGVDAFCCVICGCWKLRCESTFVAAPKVSVVAVYRASCLTSDEETLPNTLRPAFSSGEAPRLVRMNPPVPIATPAATVALPKTTCCPPAASCIIEVPNAEPPATNSFGPAINGVAAPNAVPTAYSPGEEVIAYESLPFARFSRISPAYVPPNPSNPPIALIAMGRQSATAGPIHLPVGSLFTIGFPF